MFEKKNMTNSLLYYNSVQFVQYKLDLMREKCKQKQTVIKMSQLTDVLCTLVFILLVDCN